MGVIVYMPQPNHKCACVPPPGAHHGLPFTDRDYPAGTVWRCDCGITWVSRGMVKPYLFTGHVSASLEWKRETKRARRKRERQDITPEQIWGEERSR